MVAAAAAGGGAVSWQTDSIKTAEFTAVAGEGYFCNTSGGAFAALLPAGTVGDIIGFADYASTWDSNYLTITPNGSEDINAIYKTIPSKMIPFTESLKDTYNRVIPFFEKNIQNHLQKNKNILISAHGNSLRALSKKIFKISDKKIVELEIPTGNPLLIKMDKKLQISNYRYLDEERSKKIIFNA